MALSFELTDEQKMLEETIYKWAMNWAAPQVDKWEEEGNLPPEFWLECGKLGIAGITVPEEYGGSGMGYIEAFLANEQMGRASSALPNSYGAHSILCADNIRRNGTETQKRKYLPGLCDGTQVGCLAMTEPGSGSDVMSMRTTARRDGDSWVINGSKTFITNAPGGHTLLLYAKTAPEKGAKGMSAFIVEIDPKPEGYSCNEIHKCSVRCSPTGEIAFDNVRIPYDALLGEENGGVNILTSGLATERLVVSGYALGCAKAELDLSMQYAITREQFGKPIAQFQMIQDKLANMYARWHSARLVALELAAYIDGLNDKRGGKGTDLDLKAATCYLLAGEAAIKNGMDGVQIHGGYGLCLEYPIQRHFRDSLLWGIGGGTFEVRKMIMGRELIRLYS